MSGLETTDFALIALVTVLIIENIVAFFLTKLRRKPEAAQAADGADGTGGMSSSDSAGNADGTGGMSSVDGESAFAAPPKQLLVFCLLGGALGVLVGMLASRRRTMRRWLRNTAIALAVPQLIVGLFLGFFAVYVTDFYRADETALAALESDNVVTVSQVSGYTYFDGPGTDEALIFYPGGLVQDTAYAPLMRKIAESGVDCYLEHMPYRLAFFGINRASDVLETGEAEHWYIGGHSLGGVAASVYASGNYDLLDGIVFAASYPSANLSKLDLSGLSIVGDCDGVISRDALESAKHSLPVNTQEAVIKGGNHCQFGSYGFQDGDGEATISADEQWTEAARIITKYIKGDAAA